MNRIAELQSGRRVAVSSSFYVHRRDHPAAAFSVPLIDAESESFDPRQDFGTGQASGAPALSKELSVYISQLKDRTAALQRNFGGISQFALTGGFPTPGTLQVDHPITDTGPDRKRLHFITSDLANIFFHHDAAAAFLEDANSFHMFLSIAKLMQFADGQLMFVHRHIESVADDKWIRGLNCERDHFLNILTHLTAALAPANTSVPSAVDRGQSQDSSALLPERQLSILYSCLRRAVIYLLQFLSAAIKESATFSLPLWLQHSNQLLQHLDRCQFVTCCVFQPVSFHLPLHRCLSYFLALLTVHNHTAASHPHIRQLFDPSLAALSLQHPLCLLTAV
jgi:hypothetical protein